jgi:hypothetical protein
VDVPVAVPPDAAGLRLDPLRAHRCERAEPALRIVEVTGLSPKAFLKAMRLNTAWREILEAGRDRGRITAVASRYGF